MEVLSSAEAVAGEIVRRVGLITKANGCETDIGLQVFQGLRHISEDMIPCAVVIEGPDAPGDLNVRGDIELDQSYVLYGYLPCDPLHPNVAAHAAIRDLKRAIFITNGKADKWWGRLVRGVKYLGRDIGPRTDGAAFVLAAIEIQVSYVESLSNPG